MRCVRVKLETARSALRKVDHIDDNPHRRAFEIEVSFVPAGLQETEVAYVTVEIEIPYAWLPRNGPSYASGKHLLRLKP